jgi:3-oxoadipate enol-lactonase
MNREPESGFAETDRASLYYEIVRNSEPLVLIHAGIADRKRRDGQLGALADRHQVIRYDMRGCGRSEASEGTPFSHHDDLRGCSTPLVSSELALRALWVAR